MLAEIQHDRRGVQAELQDLKCKVPRAAGQTEESEDESDIDGICMCSRAGGGSNGNARGSGMEKVQEADGQLELLGSGGYVRPIKENEGKLQELMNSNEGILQEALTNSPVQHGPT